MFHAQTRWEAHEICEHCHGRYPVGGEEVCVACDAAVCPGCIRFGGPDRQPLCPDCARLDPDDDA